MRENGAVIVWFRQDLRLQDNPALQAAVASGRPIVPLYLLDDAGEGRWRPGGASRWWLHHSLKALDESLRARGSRLILARGESLPALRSLLRSAGADAVYWNRRYEPAAVARDSEIKRLLAEEGREARSFNGSLLFEPPSVANKAGRPFQVFTPFWRHCQTLPVAPATSLPSGPLPAPAEWPSSLGMEELELLPRIPWDAGFYREWTPGEAGAQRRLKTVLKQLASYGDDRNLPGIDGTSRFSPHLHFGELGPRQIWESVGALSQGSGVFPASRGAAVFLSEIGWREFAHHLLFHFPSMAERCLRPDFERFPWNRDAARLQAWQRGRTGYPIVDAGMRQLWRTGWMHNRVRMIAGSFLVKDLLQPWQEGAAWFWDTLVDADLANNTLGWQWIAGCGADASPFFRVFNPVTQGEKFDPCGDYLRRWVPELSALPDRYLHRPWEAPAETLERARIELGKTYPRPMVDHETARLAALAALRTIRKDAPSRA